MCTEEESGQESIKPTVISTCAKSIMISDAVSTIKGVVLHRARNERQRKILPEYFYEISTSLLQLSNALWTTISVRQLHINTGESGL